MFGVPGRVKKGVEQALHSVGLSSVVGFKGWVGGVGGCSSSNDSLTLCVCPIQAQFQKQNPSGMKGTKPKGIVLLELYLRSCLDFICAERKFKFL